MRDRGFSTKRHGFAWIWKKSKMKQLHKSLLLERAMGIEPTSKAWEAYHLTQKHAGLAAFLQFWKRLNWKIMENRIGCGSQQLDRRPPGPEPGIKHI